MRVLLLVLGLVSMISAARADSNPDGPNGSYWVELGSEYSGIGASGTLAGWKVESYSMELGHVEGSRVTSLFGVGYTSQQGENKLGRYTFSATGNTFQFAARLRFHFGGSTAEEHRTMVEQESPASALAHVGPKPAFASPCEDPNLLRLERVPPDSLSGVDRVFLEQLRGACERSIGHPKAVPGPSAGPDAAPVDSVGSGIHQKR